MTKSVDDRHRSWWTSAIVAVIWTSLLVTMWGIRYANVPAPRWTGLTRVLRELALLVWLLGGAYGWGLLILSQFYVRNDEHPNPFWAVGLGFGVLWMATLIVAALHLLRAAWPWLLIGSGWLALLSSTRRCPRLRLPRSPSCSLMHCFFLIVMICSLGYSLIAWALVPPLAWDEVSYHLPIPSVFIRSGGLVNIPTIVHSNWPSGMGMLNTLALMMGSEILPHLMVTAMTLLTALGLAKFARCIFDGEVAWLAATVYLAMPMVQYLGGVALIEGALGFFGLLAIWAGYVWLEGRRWRDLAMAGILGGMAASVKLTGAAVPLAIGSTALVWLVLRHRGRCWQSILEFAGYGSIALAVVTPWYVRSFVNTGNPFWPFLYSVFGGRHWDIVGDQIHTTWLHRPNLAPTLWNYIGGLWYLTVRPAQFGGHRIGPLVLAQLPLLALFWQRKRWQVSYLIAVSWGVYTAWFFTTHQTRFLMGIMPVIALLTAYVVGRLLERWSGWVASLGQVALILYFALGLPFLNTHQRTLIADRWPYVAGHVSREQFLAATVDGYPAFQYANQYLPQDAKVLLATWETRGYYLDRETIWANPISQRVFKWEQMDDAGTLADLLRSGGITHVFWNEDLTIENVANEAHTEKLLRHLLADHGKLLYEHEGFAIYRLRTAE